MREQDRRLLRQFTAIRNGIQLLKTMQDVSSISTPEGDWDADESWRSSMSSDSSTPPHTPVSPFAHVRTTPPTNANNNWKTPRVSQLAAADTRKSSSDLSSPVQLRSPQSRYSRPKSFAQSPSAHVAWQGVKPIQRVVVLRKPVNLSPSEDELRKNKRNSWC